MAFLACSGDSPVQAHLDLRGKVMMPIHWGKFNLALHPWKEPIERILSTADMRGVSVAAPLQGQGVRLSQPHRFSS